MRLTFLVLIATIVIHSSFAQIQEEFSAGNLEGWQGDTSAFIVNEVSQLQLFSDPQSGIKSIGIPSNSINDAEWILNIHLAFNPSSSNYTDIYLTADQLNLEEVNGYFVRIGSTSDDVSLFVQNGISSTKIIDGTDDLVDISSVDLRIKITRDAIGNWELFSDIGITGNYLLEGKAFNDQFTSSSFFGIKCVFTSTRSDKFSFDYISVTGAANKDSISPKLADLLVVDENQLNVSFSEKVLLSSQNPAIHFLENCLFQQPTEVSFLNDSSFLLVFENPFPEDDHCELLISNVKDQAGNVLSDTSITFIYHPPVQPGFNQLLITEILADPSPNIELPDDEYLEIFNPTEQTFNVWDLELHIRGEVKVIPDFQIAPGEYLIICANRATELFTEYGAVLGLSNWKSLLNQGDTITLFNRKDELVFQLIYSNKWYRDSDKSDGGYSLEMIDTNNPCGEENNWIASESASGGTPGSENSVANDNPDLTSPTIQQIFPLNNNSIEILVDERIISGEIDMENVYTTPLIPIENFSFTTPLTNSFAINFSNDLSANQKYLLSYQGFADCVGNKSDLNEVTFVLPEPADSLDILFNEVMFDPVAGGSEYIEIINFSDKYIDLFQWKMIRIVEGEEKEEELLTSTHQVIEPGEILVFTEDKNILVGQFPSSDESQIIVSDLVPLNNDEGKILLVDNQGKKIDLLNYHEDFHHPLIDNSDGISLERISYFIGSSESEVWQTASSTVGGGTPGLPNSHFISPDVTTSFSIEPKVFAPDNDGYRDFASIIFNIEDPGYLASVYVFDLSGRIVKTLINHQNIPSQGNIIWEGDSDNGVKVPIGNYIVLMELTDPYGKKISMKETVAVSIKF